MIFVCEQVDPSRFSDTFQDPVKDNEYNFFALLFGGNLFCFFCFSCCHFFEKVFTATFLGGYFVAVTLLLYLRSMLNALGMGLSGMCIRGKRGARSKKKNSTSKKERESGGTFF